MSRRNYTESQKQSRREFLWRNACAALTTASMANQIFDLRMIRAAAADSIRAPKPKTKASGPTSTKHADSSSGYKALICIFMFGGNDGNNVLVPTDTATYNQYASARVVPTTFSNGIPTNGLALPNIGGTAGDCLLALNPLSNDGHTYGINPGMTALQTLFNSGKCAFVANMGTLLAPITAAQYNANPRIVSVPSQLFSHNDQQIEWQTSIEDTASATGWGGRAADLLYSLNTSQNVSMNISIAGSNIYENGVSTNEYNVSSSGAISLTQAGNSDALNAFKAALNVAPTNLYENAYYSQMNTAINDATQLNAAITATAASNFWTTTFPTSSLGTQLKMVARLIQAAPTLGQNRQIFFCSTGGFDLHGSEGSYLGSQQNLLADMSASMNALYQASVQLGVSTGVTQFTASDFSRTFPMNSIFGADHGWGNNHWVVGGGVSGQKIYGTYPTLQQNGPDDTNTGRWVPSTSVDQYGATLAKWFGVSSGNMSQVFPYVGRFATADLGFMG